MPLLETKGAASAQGFGLTLRQPAANYIEDVFSTWIYTGTSATQSINNGVDLSTKGGLVWVKRRSPGEYHVLTDTARGAGKQLFSDLTASESSTANQVTAFNTNGFTLGADSSVGWTNLSPYTYASWTFRKQPKFFDVVTYTGDGANNRQISHSLGSAPGFIVVKNVTNAQSWICYHRSLGTGKFIILNSTGATSTDANAFPTVTSTYFVPTANQSAFTLNTSGDTFVAYLFAHDAGGFGLTGTDNVISCGSYTGTNAAGNAQNLGYEPQWLLIKSSSGTGDWFLLDNMRGIPTGGNDAVLQPNSSIAEFANANRVDLTATGFQFGGADLNNSGTTYIYIAIRRGPMKTPTTGTSVFSPVASSAATGTALTTNFPVDMQMGRPRLDVASASTVDRLRGVSTDATGYGLAMNTNSTGGEASDPGTALFWDNTGFQMPANLGGISDIFWNFRRAPGFFDEVCYTGTGANTTQTHNLGVVPELMIVKRRDTTGAWQIYSAALANTEYLVLNTTAAKATGTTRWNSTTPTASVFTIGTDASVNASGGSYVAYLFASAPGVSKVGSYTGNGTSLTVNCGFTGGARFVLIKRTNATGDWVVFDSARGIVAGNDPFLELNTTAAEQTGEDAVDADSTGFIVNQTAENLNVSGGQYIFLAIA